MLHTLASVDQIRNVCTVADGQRLAGAAYAESKGGVVMTKVDWVGFENIIRFSIRVNDGPHELVRL